MIARAVIASIATRFLMTILLLFIDFNSLWSKPCAKKIFSIYILDIPSYFSYWARNTTLSERGSCFDPGRMYPLRAQQPGAVDTKYPETSVEFST